jgi:Ca2+-binding RTX toxin-like protein
VRVDYLGNGLDQAGGIGIDDRGNFVVLIAGVGILPDGSRSAPLHGQGFAGYLDTRPSCLRIIATHVGTNQAETIEGTPGADVVLARGGDDRIDTGEGNDVICGGAGADVIYAGPGDDRIAAGGGDDVIDGGEDNDWCNGEGHTNADTAVQCEWTANIP